MSGQGINVYRNLTS